MNKIEQPSIGIKAVLDQALQSYERLPMLEIIFDKFSRQLAIALRNLTSEPINVEIKKIHSLRFGTYFNTLQNPSSLAVFRALEWENFGLLIIDNSLIFSFIDLLLGGKKNINHSVMDSDKRSLTAIEQALARQISEVILNELSSAFESISPTTFLIERLENNPNFATIVRPGDAIIVLTVVIELDQQWEKLDLVIPYKTIEPVKQQMQQVFLGDRLMSDNVWEQKMFDVVYHIDLPIEAVIINKPIPLNKVANLKVGDTIITDYKQDEDITIRTGPIALFKGQVGKVENKVAISIKNIIED